MFDIIEFGRKVNNISKRVNNVSKIWNILLNISTIIMLIIDTVIIGNFINWTISSLFLMIIFFWYECLSQKDFRKIVKEDFDKQTDKTKKQLKKTLEAIDKTSNSQKDEFKDFILAKPRNRINNFLKYGSLSFNIPDINMKGEDVKDFIGTIITKIERFSFSEDDSDRENSYNTNEIQDKKSSFFVSCQLADSFRKTKMEEAVPPPAKTFEAFLESFDWSIVNDQKGRDYCIQSFLTDAKNVELYFGTNEIWIDSSIKDSFKKIVADFLFLIERVSEGAHESYEARTIFKTSTDKEVRFYITSIAYSWFKNIGITTLTERGDTTRGLLDYRKKNQITFSGLSKLEDSCYEYYKNLPS